MREKRLKVERLSSFSFSMQYPRRLVPLIVLSVALLFAELAAAAAYRVDQGSVSRDKRVLTAGPDGAHLTLQHGIKVRLAAGSVIRSHKPAKLWLDNKGRTHTLVFSLRDGRVDVTVPEKKRQLRRAVLVQTSRKLSGAVSSGKLTVLSQPSHGVVANYGGVVVARDEGRWSKVAPGHFASVTRTQSKAVQSPLPGAPKVSDLKRVWLSLGKKVGLDGFSWSAGEASSFEWRVASNGEKVQGGVTQERRPRPGSIQVGPGIYDLSVAAVNSYGLSGPPSAPVSVNVVGLAAGTGSRIDEAGTIHVGAERRARFSSVDGLLMAYGKSRRWVTASPSVPVHGSKRMIVLFRHPSSSNVVSARLQPRSVRAQVRVGSKTEQWPRDAVKLSVRLQDSVGGKQLQGVQPKIVVEVGLEEVPVTWQRSGNELEAQLAPRSGPGPWVVRVTVYDQYGVQLGRDFLEVIEQPAAREQRIARPARAAN